MASIRIVCTEQEPAGTDHDVAHIVAVGVRDDPSSADNRLEVGEVRSDIQNGHTYYTKRVNRENSRGGAARLRLRV